MACVSEIKECLVDDGVVVGAGGVVSVLEVSLELSKSEDLVGGVCCAEMVVESLGGLSESLVSSVSV